MSVGLLQILFSYFSKLGRFFGTFEHPSPADIVPHKNILVQSTPVGVWVKLVRLNIPFTKDVKVWVPMIPNTNSMDGVFDFGNNNILIQGADDTNQKILVDYLIVGDIAVYETLRGPTIHRIVKIGQDKEGRYFKFKGDNNPAKDPGKIRDEQISWLSIGVIY